MFPRNAERKSPAPLAETEPLRFELLYVDPARITHAYRASPPDAPFFDGGRWIGVANGEWDRFAVPLASRSAKQIALRKHFEDGLGWEDCGILDVVRAGIAKHGVFDGCRTEADLRARYDRLDRIVEQVRAEGRLQAPWELGTHRNPQRAGIRVYMQRNGEIMFAGRGNHRLAMAQHLKLPLIPVSLVVVHRDAIRDGHLVRARVQRQDHLQQLGLSPPRHGFGMRRPVLLHVAGRLLGRA